MAETRPWWKRALLWEIPFLAALAGFMFWVRMLPYKALVGSGRAYFIGTDPFYHYRETLGTVRAFPRIPRWDPWTNYPLGTATNQFGTLFDWAAAAYVVLTEGKDASEAYVQTVLGVYPAILGAILIVPFYFLAKRLLGTWGAIVASIALALLPGEFLIRSIAGYSDHHVAEALMCLVSLLGVYVAAERGHEARAALRDWRNPRGYAKAILFGVLGGVALGLNFYVWPPALLFLAILTVWLTIVVLLENAKGNDPRGLAFGASVSFVVAGLMMIPVIETTDLGDFNAYGILQVVAPIGAALWIVLLDVVAGAFRARRVAGWVLPSAILALGVLAYVAVAFLAARVLSSLAWGLSWVTGFGVRRTTLTIAEARAADFLCSADTSSASCLATDFGIVAPLSLLLLVALAVWTLVKRRHSDILLLLWTLVAFRATNTQIRFSYYAALNMALLLGWAAARVAEGVGLEKSPDEPVDEGASPKAAKGRKTRRAVVERTRSRPLQIAAVAAVLLILLPGNVFATGSSVPGWRAARIGQADGDLVVWLDGLDWMRENTPSAGVDLGAVIPRQAPGELYAYPPETYGVLSWWDYGHWIETTALRPPVANPFQQGAEFASLWFTERDPAAAERALDERVQGKGPVRYVLIDDEMATGKFGAITVWANGLNASRAQWAGGDYLVERSLRVEGQQRQLLSLGPEYQESMMGRLYDADGDGLGRYRLVWESPQYRAVGNVANARGETRCVHDAFPSNCAYVSISNDQLAAWRADPGAAVRVAEDAYVYDLEVQSRLKLFERVEGAQLAGAAPPGSVVTASARIRVAHETGEVREWTHTERAVADADGRYVIPWPYPTTGFLSPAEGGTNAIAVAQGPVRVGAGGASVEVDVTEREVLDGAAVEVA